MLIIPGFMTDPSLWDGVIDRLQPYGPVVHADLGLEHTLDGMARRALAQAPAQSFILVGFSMGGYVARELVRMAPERVAALVLVATSSRPDTAALARSKGAIANADASLSFNGLSRRAVATSLHPRERDNEALIERVRAMGLRLGAEVFRRQSMLVRPGDTDRLHEITCPTLIVAAGHDQLRGIGDARELHEGIAGSTLRVIEDSGHMIPLEAPQALADVVTGWLDGSVPQPTPITR